MKTSKQTFTRFTNEIFFRLPWLAYSTIPLDMLSSMNASAFKITEEKIIAKSFRAYIGTSAVSMDIEKIMYTHATGKFQVF